MKKLIFLLPLSLRRFITNVIFKIWVIIPPIIQKLVKQIISEKIWIWKNYIGNIYPIKIPAIEFLPYKDFILMELPQRYMPFMPNGLGYVSNILKSIGISFQVLDLNIILYHRYHSQRILGGTNKSVSSSGYIMRDDPWDLLVADEWNKPEFIEYFRPEINQIIDGLVKARPKIIGISLSNTNHSFAREVVKGIHAAYPEAVIVVGGYDCVYHYVGPHLFQDFDYMVIGEAELTLGPLVKALVAGERPKDIPGVISKFDTLDRIWENGPLLKNLDSIDFPRYEWTNISLYRSYDGRYLVPIITSRGCRWSRCRFCAECFNWRKRSPNKVVDEIEWFVKQGFHDLLFNDSDMNGDPDTLIEICNGILRRRLKISFTGELRIHKRRDKEFFKRLRAAGCHILVFGVDGWTDHMISLQNKGYTMDMVEENLSNCHKAGILINVNLVTGIPGETEEDIEGTIANILKYKQYIFCLQNINLLILVAGSEYYLNPERYNIRFYGEKQDLYKNYPTHIPSGLWYTVNPYVDHKIRVSRLKKIYNALEGSVNIGEYARWTVERDSQEV